MIHAGRILKAIAAMKLNILGPGTRKLTNDVFSVEICFIVTYCIFVEDFCVVSGCLHIAEACEHALRIEHRLFLRRV